MGERSALVTGASGFVGRNLVAELLDRGWRVVALGRSTSGAIATQPGLETAVLHEIGDLPTILDGARVDAVFHLAAHQSRGHRPSDIDAFLEANLRLGMHLFAAAADRGIRVIDALSYFQFRDGVPVAHSLYSATKQAQAEFARFWRDRLGADIRDVILFDNYGANDGRDKLIPALIRAVRSGERLTIGPLEQLVDLLHVRDVATGLISVAEGMPRGPLAIRADEFATVGSIVDLVGRAAGAPVPVVIDPARGSNDGPRAAGTWDRPAGWSPEVALPVGIAECVAGAN